MGSGERYAGWLNRKRTSPAGVEPRDRNGVSAIAAADTLRR
jgi:hypothetical protein